MSAPACSFCEVVSDRADAEVVGRWPGVLASLDLRPVFKGHVLVVPDEHVETLTDLSQGAIEPVFTAVQQVAAAVRTALGAQGSFVAANNTVSQSVPHLHVHVVPRTKGDGLRGFFWPRQRYAGGEMGEYAARLREVLPH